MAVAVSFMPRANWRERPRPRPSPILHFTHVSHLASIATSGLVSDTLAQDHPSFQVEVGNQGIKGQRRLRAVPIAPGGVVADYAPFYFAPRSPMMYAIEKGNVPSYEGGCDELLYLVSTVETIVRLRLPYVFTDRNAVLGVAKYGHELRELDTLIDWQLMEATIWRSTEAEPDRRERRMAEFLVYERVPWAAFHEVVVRNRACAERARDTLVSIGASHVLLSGRAGTSEGMDGSQ